MKKQIAIFEFIPSENLSQYIRFKVRSKKNDIDIPIEDYRSALIVFQSLMKTAEVVDDITLEGFNSLDNCFHTIWYSHKKQQKPFIFYYNK